MSDNSINLDDMLEVASQETAKDISKENKETSNYTINEDLSIVINDVSFEPIELDKYDAASFLGLHLGLAVNKEHIRLNYTHIKAINKKFFDLQNYHPKEINLESSTYDYFKDVLLKNIHVKMFEKRFLPVNGIKKHVKQLTHKRFSDGSSMFEESPLEYTGEDITGVEWLNRCMTDDPKHRQGQYIFFLTGMTISILAQQIFPELNISFPLKSSNTTTKG